MASNFFIILYTIIDFLVVSTNLPCFSAKNMYLIYISHRRRCANLENKQSIVSTCIFSIVLVTTTFNVYIAADITI